MISIAAVPATLLVAFNGQPDIVPSVAVSSKSFTFNSDVGTQYWSDGGLDHPQQNVSTGQGTPITASIVLPYKSGCSRGFGGGYLFNYKPPNNVGGCSFSAGVNNLQSFEFEFQTYNSGWNMASCEFHATATYKDINGETVYCDHYDLVNGDTVDENSPLHANTPITYSWIRSGELVGNPIRSVLLEISFDHLNTLLMRRITVGWSC